MINMKLVVLMLLSCAFANATEYYVSPSGTDTNDCSALNPCREIASVTGKLNAGDTVNVADGQYAHFIVDTKIGLPTAPITIMALGSNAVISSAPVNVNNWRTQDNIIVWQSEWIVLSGLKTFNAPRAGFMVNLSTNVTIENCVSGNNQKWGLFSGFLSNISLFNNEFYGSIEQHGAYLSDGVMGGIVVNNYFHDNAGSGLQTNGREGSRLTIASNRVERNGKHGAAGINLLSVVERVDVHDNQIINNYNAGIAVIRGSFNHGPKDIKIHNNTIIMDPTGHSALAIHNLEGPVVIEHNLIYTPHSAFDTSTDQCAFIRSNNNTVSCARTVLAPAFTWSQWQGLGQDKDSTYVIYSATTSAIAIPNY